MDTCPSHKTYQLSLQKMQVIQGYSTISQSKVRTILEEADIKPNKITYYCENRDPDLTKR